MRARKFRKPAPAEQESIDKLIDRRRNGTEYFVNLASESPPMISVIEENGKTPFTTVLVNAGGKLFVGTSKRTRYAQRADAYDPQIGFDVALARAAKTNPIEIS